MNLRKITLLSYLLISVVVLFACTQEQKKVSANNEQVVQKKENADDGQVELKNSNRNKSVNDLPNEQNLPNMQNQSQQLPDVIFYKGSSQMKRVALTFDDGPDNYYTPRILDILRAKGAPGTFFIVGKEAKRFPDMVRRIVNEGNAIGNHSWDHAKLWTLTNEQVTQEINSTENEIEQITGSRSNLFRPPYGRVTSAEVVQIHNLGYRIVDWSVDTLDWKGTPAPTILQIVNKEVSPGGIILEHSLAGRQGELNGTLEALPQIIDHLRAEGYEFVTVSTLLSQ